MRRILKALSSGGKSQLRHNFLVVLQANVLAQIVALAVAPLLSRLYTPSDFGTIAIFVAAFQLLAAICTARLDWSIPNAYTERQAISLFIAGFLVLCLVCVYSLIMIAVQPPVFNRWSGFITLGNLVWLLPVTVFGHGLNQLLQGWFVRQNNLVPVSRMAVAQSLGNAVVSVVLGALQVGVVGLVIATVVGAWLGIGMMIRRAAGLFPTVFLIASHEICDAGKRFWKEGCISSVVSLINAASAAAPVIMLAMYFSVQEVGWYSLMLRMAAAPVGVVGRALSQSFWARASELVRAKEYNVLSALYLKIIRLLLLAAVPVAVACFAGPWYVGFIFGTEWTGAGQILFALSPMLVGITVFSSTNHLIVFSRQDLQLIGDGFRLLAVVASVYVAHLNGWSFLTAVWLVSISSLIAYIILFGIHRYVQMSLAKVVMP